MESTILIKKEYNSLEELCNYLKNKTSYTCSKEYDIWDHRINSNGQMEQCLVIKKSGMHAVKVFFVNDNTVKVNYIIPNKMLNAYFGKNVKTYRSILEIIAGKVKDMILATPQQKAFTELEKVVRKAS